MPAEPAEDDPPALSASAASNDVKLNIRKKSPVGDTTVEDPNAMEEELDDFGLPVQKFKQVVLDDSDSDDGDGFKTPEEGLPASSPERTKEPKFSQMKTDIPPSDSVSSVHNATIEKSEDSKPIAIDTTPDRQEGDQHPQSDVNDSSGDIRENDRHNSQGVPAEPTETMPNHVQNKHNTDEKRISEHALKVPDVSQKADTELEAEKAVFFKTHSRNTSTQTGKGSNRTSVQAGGVSEWSHQQGVQQQNVRDDEKEEDEWQTMPSYAPFDLYDDDGKLIAREHDESDDGIGALGGARKGYTKVTMDDDVQSQTSMDENTSYLFKEPPTHSIEDENEQRDTVAQMQATKDFLTEGQRIAYVGVTRLAMVEMLKELEKIEGSKKTKKEIRVAVENMKMWSQKMMVRLYAHMEISSAEQVMIEQLAEHGLKPGDLTGQLMQNARVKNPMAEEKTQDDRKPSLIGSPRPSSITSPRQGSIASFGKGRTNSIASSRMEDEIAIPPPPPYEEHENDELPEVRTPSQLPTTQKIDLDLRWTVLCDLFLILIADSVYDSRSRVLLELVGNALSISWVDICKFEKRVTDSLEMQEAADKENWNEDEHKENRRKMALKRRYMMMGLATVGGSLVIGLSAGLLAPVIGAGLAAGFTTIGVAGTSGFLAGAGGAALITSTAALSGGVIAVRASDRRTGAVQTFEYRPLHNNKRVNLIVTVSGWMNGKVDDVRLPYSTVDPIMGDIYSVLWEPEMLQSMGQTINILATEALTQGLQQVLGSTVLVALMASLQLPIVLTKLSYLIDNPWTVSLGRANAAGLILADSLIDRNLGVRPVTLVGYSLGSRLIYSCLRELANKQAYGLVQNVFLFGSPIVAKKDEYLLARSVVSGRFVNGYASNDWILGYLFRATSGGIMRVAGLAPVEDIPGLENVEVTELVNGHMAYRTAMPRLLREVGFLVESDEFAEIEDPDPENHQQRQRELINEIDEARKELEKKPEKKKFGFFGRNKKLAEKKAWETYDEKSMKKNEKKGDEVADDKELNVLFDIDAIRRELESEMIEVREIESTLPPMKIELKQPSYTSFEHIPEPVPARSPELRQTKSHGDERFSTPLKSPKKQVNGSSPRKMSDYDEYDDGGVRNSIPLQDEKATMTFSPPLPSPAREASTPISETSQRPSITKAATMPPVNMNPEHNAWADADDDEFGKEKEITMSFA